MGNKSSRRKQKSPDQGAATEPVRKAGDTDAAAAPSETKDGKGASQLPKTVEYVAATTKFTTDDVRELFQSFKELAAQSEDPNRITKEQFIQVLKDHSIAWRTDDFASRLFEYFDRSEDGKIDFKEYARALSTLSSGSPREKLQFSFEIMDVEGTGRIAKWEMKQVLHGIYCDATMFQESKPDGQQMEQRKANINQFVDRIFAEYDKDSSGQLTFMEYLQASMAYPGLVDFMNNFSFDEKYTAPADEEEQGVKAGEKEDPAPAAGTAATTAPLAPTSPAGKVSVARPVLAGEALEDGAKFSPEDIKSLKEQFEKAAAMSEDPSVIQRHQFREILEQHQVDWRSDEFADRLFDAIDVSGSNTINWREYLCGISALCKASPRERLELSFEVFDVDGTGKITRTEMKSVLRAYLNGESDEVRLDDFVSTVFDESDRDRSGGLSLREFVNASMRFEGLVSFRPM